MCNKEELYEKVYNPMKDLKDRFYKAADQEQWDVCKEELIELLTTAESMMDKDWYEKWKTSQFDSITKMHQAKEKWWNKAQQKPQYTPKKTFLLQDDLAAALTDYIKLQTKLLEYQYKNIFEKSDETK